MQGSFRFELNIIDDPGAGALNRSDLGANWMNSTSAAAASGVA
jgi:hypothetical protein